MSIFHSRLRPFYEWNQKTATEKEKTEEYHSCWDKAFDPQAMYVNIEGIWILKGFLDILRNIHLTYRIE